VKLRRRYLPVVAVLGAAVAVLPALAAAPSEAKLEVNENCVESAWPCWATPGSGSKPAPASRVTIAAGGEVVFADNTATKANIAWLGTAPVCSSGVPVSPTSPQTSWEGKCKFEQPGTYRFESSTLFNDGYDNYTKYEIVVEGATTGTTSTTATTTPTSTTPTTTTPTTTTPTTTTPTTTTPTATTSTQPSGGGAAPSEAKLEVNENCVEPAWPCWAAPGSGSKPAPASKVTIAAGGEVVFTDDTATKANIAWTGAAPTCSSSVPVGPTAPQAHWEGKCKFEQPGTYRFESSTLWPEYTKYEIVVEGAGTTPTTTTSTPTTPSKHGHGSPLAGGARALELAGSQRGSTVHGSLEVSQAGSGGRLEVGLFAADALLAKAGHSEEVRVGRLVRSSVKAGSVSFSVPLNSKGRAALRRRRRLAVTVKITLTPPHGAAATVTRGVVVRARD
jgi:hypothetical protein